MTKTERPIVCKECREAMPDINWNHPCPHAKFADPTKKSKFLVIDGGMFRRHDTLYDALECVNKHGGDIYEPLASDAARQVVTIEDQEKKIERLRRLIRCETIEPPADVTDDCTTELAVELAGAKAENERLRAEIDRLRALARAEELAGGEE